jgi:hypothetical protein
VMPLAMEGRSRQDGADLLQQLGICVLRLRTTPL